MDVPNERKLEFLKTLLQWGWRSETPTFGIKQVLPSRDHVSRVGPLSEQRRARRSGYRKKDPPPQKKKAIRANLFLMQKSRCFFKERERNQ